MYYNTTGSNNTSVGQSALFNNTTASNNTAVGYQAGYSNQTGSYISAFGYLAGYSTTGGLITAIGYQALKANTTGRNTSVGVNSSGANITGSGNTVVGDTAFANNTAGSSNTAIGDSALYANLTSSYSTAVGYQAGYSNTVGAYNTFIGYQAGYTSNGSSTGSNSCVGAQAGYYLTTGIQNQFLGQGAGYYITTGSYNTIIGSYNGNQGGLDIRIASNYIVLSDGAGTPGIYGKPNASDWTINTGTSGTLYVQGIYTFTSASAANVFVNSGGALLRSTSALKYKQDIRDLEEINVDQIRAVRYKSKCANDDQTVDHFGVIADEVDAAGIKELVTYGANGEVEGFQYERLTVVLLKEIQSLRARLKAANIA
jgi:hypothetical protein